MSGAVCWNHLIGRYRSHLIRMDAQIVEEAIDGRCTGGGQDRKKESESWNPSWEAEIDHEFLRGVS